MESMRENLVKKLMTATKCTVCGQNYRVDDIGVLGHEDDLWFLTVACGTCNTQYLVAAVMKEGRVPAAVTDLTEAEHERFKRVQTVTADDVLNMHDFLKVFNGDFHGLFGQDGLE